MTARLREYQPETDFLRVRDFLSDTYGMYGSVINWTIERWNYARYFVAPMLGAYGQDTDGQAGGLKAIRLWEDLVGIWEDTSGRIVGVACIEHPDPDHPGYGEVFLQRHPEQLDLLPDMLAYGEKRFVTPTTGRAFIWAHDDDDALLEVLLNRDYVKEEDRSCEYLQYEIGELPAPALPDGFELRTMARETDIERRCEIFGRSFNHEDPREWPSVFSYHELQKAPDYRPDQDLVIVAPDGRYAACCIFWFDEPNQLGLLEPLGAHPDFRRLGLARELQFESLRRLKTMGATHMPMIGGFEPFYEAVGFRRRGTLHRWSKQV